MRKLEDAYLHKGLRNQLVGLLKEKVVVLISADITGTDFFTRKLLVS